MTETQRALVTDHLEVVHRHCRALAARRHVPYDDVVRNGYLAACQLAVAWDGRGTFVGWLDTYLDARIVDALRGEEGRPGRGYHARTVGYDPALHDRPVYDHSALEALSVVARCCAPRDVELVVGHLLHDERFSVLAARQGVSESRALQRYRAALRHVRHVMAA